MLHKTLYKPLLIALLIPLILLEAYFCTAFLPLEQQHAINAKIPNILPQDSQTLITHPNLDQEVDQVVREHVSLRIAIYAVTIILLVANGWVIRSLWRPLLRDETARAVG